MTEIRWKNGGPLFIQPRPGGGPIGLVAVDQDCCCGDGNPPPPPRCWDCSDTCSYFLELTLPEELAVKTPSVTCGQFGPAEDGVNLAAFPFSSALPPSLSPAVELSSAAVTVSPGGIVFDHGRGLLGGLVSAQWDGEVESDCGSLNPVLSVRLFVQVSVLCESGRASSPAYAVFNGHIICSTVGGSLAAEPECSAFWAWYFGGEFDIPVGGCQSSPQRSCFGYTDAFKFITTPLTFTIDKNGSSLGGSFTTTGLIVSPDNTATSIVNLVQTTGEAVRDALAATFRITSRPACTNIPADCDVPIEGRIVYFPKNSVAVYGYEFGTPKTDVYDFGAWEFAHDGVANGTAESPYVFNAKKFAENPAGFILEEHNLEVFCALDDTVTPPVSRWYVREFVYCTPAFGRQTTDQWISEILTYPEPDRETPCEGVSAGDPVPVGITEYERVDGYPIVDFGEPCDPPPPIGLQITDGCS